VVTTDNSGQNEIKIYYRAINDKLTCATGCFKFMSATYQVSNLLALEHRGVPLILRRVWRVCRRDADAAVVDLLVRLGRRTATRLLGITSGTSMGGTPGYLGWKDGAATGLAKIRLVDLVR
jgi:hypothetical protein